MEPELVRYLLDAGLPSALLAVIAVMNWRRRNGRPANEGEPSGAVFYQLAALAQDVKEVSRGLNDINRYLNSYERANETANRERHDEMVAAVDVISRDVKDIQRRQSAA
jgi:hypothetical protein